MAGILENKLLTLSWQASTDLEANRVVAPVVASSEQVEYCIAGVAPLGVTQESADSGNIIGVVNFGLVKLTCGGAVTRGQMVAVTGTAGKVVNATVTDSYSIGIALESGLLNELVTVMVIPTVLVTTATAVLNKQIFVDKIGNDITGDGSPSKPLLTIQAAIDAIATAADNSTSVPYTIEVGAGVFTENLTFEDAALVDITIKGQGKESTRITHAGATCVTSTADNDALVRLVFQDIGFVKGMTLTGASAATNFLTEGVFLNCDFENTADITATNANLIIFRGCGVLSNDLTLSNIALLAVEGGSITGAIAITSDSTANQPSGMGANTTVMALEGAYAAVDPAFTIVGAGLISMNLLGGSRLGTATIDVDAGVTINNFNSLIASALTGAGALNDYNGFVTGNIANTLTVSGDSALVGEHNILRVEKHGNDTTGNGSIRKPFLTIGQAVAQVVANADNSAVNGYVISIGEGVFDELVVLEDALLVNLTFQGKGAGVTTITPAGAVSVRSQATNDNLVSLRFKGITFGKDITITGASNATTLMTTGLFEDCRFLADADLAIINANNLEFNNCGDIAGDVIMNNVALFNSDCTNYSGAFTPTADSTSDMPVNMAANTIDLFILDSVSAIDSTPAIVGAGVCNMWIKESIWGNAGVTIPVGAVLTGIETTFTGSYVSEGAITFTGGSVSGNVTSGAGAFTLTNCPIGGNVITGAGAVTCNGSHVIGDVTTTGAGAFTSQGCEVIGNAVTGAGAINMTNASIGGNLTTSGAGNATCVNCSIGGSILSTTGAILITNGNVGVNAITGAGAITIVNGNVGGDLTSTGAGVIIVTNCMVGDDVTSTTGAITMNGGSVGGDVISGAGLITLNGANVAGGANLAGAGNIVQIAGWLGGSVAGAGGGAYTAPTRIHFSPSADPAVANTLFVNAGAGNILAWDENDASVHSVDIT